MSASIFSAPTDKENSANKLHPVIFFQPNTTQLFTELYQAYGLLNPPPRTFFEEALYLDQSIPPKVVPLQPSIQAIFDHANLVLSDFHRSVNDLELYKDPSQTNHFFYTATGSKQLIVALVYSIAMSEPNKKFVFVEQAPYYSGHPNAVSGIFNYPNARFVAFHNPSEINLNSDEILVEFVTSPNNPDGKFRRPITDAKIIIGDFVFASSAFGSDGTGYVDPNIEWIRAARAQGKHVFSFNSASKQFGKTALRCGYLWYPMYDEYAASIFNKFFCYISASTVAAGSAGLAEFLNLIKALLDNPAAGKALRSDANQSLIKRHELVEKELVHRYPGSLVLSIPGSPTFFAKINDARIPKKQAADLLADDFDAIVNGGLSMGESNEFIRLNLSGYSQGLVAFLNRLAGEKKYRVQDVLLISNKECFTTKVSEAIYYVKPGDCHIEANASKEELVIHFPPFIGYDINEIQITKMDQSENSVLLKLGTKTATLKKPGDTINVQWTQPFYLEGSWQIVNQ